MEKFVLVLVFTSLLCFNVKSQEFTRTNASGFQDVAVAPNGTIWACGTNGTIWYSTSNGNTWTQIEASGFKSIGANDNNIIACGDNETVWIANGSGASFQRTSATGFRDVAISPGGRMVGAGTNETIWTSSIQSPNSWSRTEASGFISVDNNDNHIVAAGSNGKIWIANINGTDWIETSASGFRQVSVAPSGVIYAVGTIGTLWSSYVSNRGQKWEQLAVTDVKAVDLNDSKVVIVKNDGTIWYKNLYNDGKIVFYNQNTGATAVTNYCLENQRRFNLAPNWTHIASGGRFYSPMTDGALFYNSNTGLVNAAPSNDLYNTQGNRTISNGWTHIVSSYKLLFYNGNTGGATMTDHGLNTISTHALSGGWTHIESSIEGFVFYNANSGSATITDGNLATLRSSSNLSGGWSLVVPIGSNILFYRNDGTAVITDGNFRTVWTSANLSGGWTHIIPTCNGILFYDSRTGAATLTNSTNLETIRTYSFSAGWTHIGNMESYVIN